MSGKRRWLNRELVINRAVAMADEAGSVTAVSLTALAESLDVRVPSLYNHVASLEDLQHGMAVAGVRLLLDELRRATNGLVARPSLEAMAHAYRQFALAHPGIYPLTIRAPEPDDAELGALAQELVQMLLLVWATVGLTGDDALHATRGFRAVLHGFTALEMAEGYRLSLGRDESFQRLVAAYLDGVIRGK
ncbi:MAG TPA: TetR-like C-terminal domain-containing protein [Chloroflexota bacterium]|nr:TetR-like C-terminal domain-containing protein [Chloroflexota bacterium]